MRIRRNAWLAVLAATILSAAFGAGAPGSPENSYTFDDIERVVAIGDVHGAYDDLVLLLRGTDLVDSELAWSGGDDHLVLVGDLIDRGPRDREILDLARRLQQEALQSGGRVHVLLGNHEVMNLTRDLRYVSPESFAPFVAQERKRDRQTASQRFRRNGAQRELGMRAFVKRFPPGYFGRVRAFAADGEYGAWLLEQPAIVKINGVVFVHGGLDAEVAELGLQGINEAVRQGVLDFLRHAAVLEESTVGLASNRELFDAAEGLADGSGGARQTAAARAFLELSDSIAFAPRGPLWYRGNSIENERLERFDVARSLEALEARAVVVGHTPTRGGRITRRFGGQVYRADVGMVFGAPASALVLRDEELLVFDSTMHGFTRAPLEAPGGDGWASGHEEFPDRQLEQFLATATVDGATEIVRGDRHIQLLELRQRELRLRAVFQFVNESVPVGTPPELRNPRRFLHEVAAYRLDRHLGLRMVPVAVPRAVEGRPGSVQVFLETALDRPFIEDHDRWDLIEGLDEQIEHAKLFTALVGTRDRLGAAEMLLPKQRRIMIADNSKGFPLTIEVADLVPDPCGPLAPDVEFVLRELDREGLTEVLGGLLEEAQIEAILGRRDRILEICTEPPVASDVEM